MTGRTKGKDTSRRTWVLLTLLRSVTCSASMWSTSWGVFTPRPHHTHTHKGPAMIDSGGREGGNRGEGLGGDNWRYAYLARSLQPQAKHTNKQRRKGTCTHTHAHMHIHTPPDTCLQCYIAGQALPPVNLLHPHWQTQEKCTYNHMHSRAHTHTHKHTQVDWH